MKVLITSAGDNLARQIANSLGDDHEILLTDCEDVSTRFPFVRSDLNHTQPTNDLVRGVDVIVHSGAVDPRDSVSDQLDYQMRCTYNLLEGGVGRRRAPFRVPQFVAAHGRLRPVVCGYRALETDAHVGAGMSFATTSARSCAGSSHGSGRLEVTILRLGEITPASEENPSTSALYEDDAIEAVRLSLTADHSGWLDIFHIQSDVPDARFLTGQPWQSADDVAQAVSLGYAPRKRG